jgi:ribonucleoside-diphosphate reductase alpha chain
MKHIDYPEVLTNFSPNALKIMEQHYYLKDHSGKLTERCPSEVFKRICGFYHRNGMEVEKCKFLYKLLMKQIVALNSPIYYNVRNDKNSAQCLACFMGQFEDSIDSINSEISKAVKIFKRGAGFGHNYGDLRPSSASIGDGGKNIDKFGGSSGPLSFLKVVNVWAREMKSGGHRRAAYLATLDCTHPDIEKFIKCKSIGDERESYVYANLSVFLTNDFMLKVVNNEQVDLEWGGVVYKTVNAADLFYQICEGAKTSGDPGVLFGDTAQEYNTLEEFNGKPTKVRTTNACSELVAYAPHFCCNLGHINLYKLYLFCQEENLNLVTEVGKISSFLSDFLDKNIDITEYPDEVFEVTAKRTRPISIGVMGFGEMLMAAKIRYGSIKSIDLAEEISEELTLSALERATETQSSYEELSNSKNRLRLVGVLRKYEERSSIKKDRWTHIISHILSGGHFRNCAVSSVAPTGNSGLISDSGTTGIEPAFALYHTRNVAGQSEPLRVVDFELEKFMKENKYENVFDIQGMPDHFISAHDIDPIGRIKVQAAFQKFIMFGISSTINLAKDTPADKIRDIYLTAWKSGLKGITVFVDGCLKSFGGSQVLEREESKMLDSDIEICLDGKEIKEQNRILKITLTKTRQKVQGLEDKLKIVDGGFKRPINVKSETFCFKLQHNRGVHEFLVTVGEINGKPIEVIITLGKSGTDEHAWAEAVGRLISMALQTEIPLDRICKKIRDIKGDLSNFVKFEDKQERSVMIYSIPDLTARLLEYKYLLKDKIEIEGAQECSECNNLTLVFEAGCQICKNPECDYKKACG